MGLITGQFSKDRFRTRNGVDCSSSNKSIAKKNITCHILTNFGRSVPFLRKISDCQFKMEKETQHLWANLQFEFEFGTLQLKG
jgi:hypothetical protein